MTGGSIAQSLRFRWLHYFPGSLGADLEEMQSDLLQAAYILTDTDDGDAASKPKKTKAEYNAAN